MAGKIEWMGKKPDANEMIFCRLCREDVDTYSGKPPLVVLPCSHSVCYDCFLEFYLEKIKQQTNYRTYDKTYKLCVSRLCACVRLKDLKGLVKEHNLESHQKWEEIQKYKWTERTSYISELSFAVSLCQNCPNFTFNYGNMKIKGVPTVRACPNCGVLMEFSGPTSKDFLCSCGHFFCFVCLSCSPNHQSICHYNNLCLVAPRQKNLGRPRPLYATKESFVFFKHRRRDVDPDISESYRGSSWQIAEYKDVHGDIWIGKVPAQPLEQLFNEVIGARFYWATNIPTSVAVISEVDMINQNINLLPEGNRYAIMSKKSKNFSLLGEEVIHQLTSSGGDIFVSTGERRIPLHGLGSLLAVAKWIGDTDCLGASGKNAGYQKLMFSGPSPIAYVHKIDPGWFAQDFPNTNVMTKNIYLSPRDIIAYDQLSAFPKCKAEFLEVTRNICELHDLAINNIVMNERLEENLQTF